MAFRTASRICLPTTRSCWPTSRPATHPRAAGDDARLRRDSAAAGSGARRDDRSSSPGLVETPLEEVLPLQLSERGDACSLRIVCHAAMNRVSLTPAGEAHPVMQLGDRAEDVRENGGMPRRRSPRPFRSADRARAPACSPSPAAPAGPHAPRRRAALRRGAIDGLHGRGIVALADAAAVVRSFGSTPSGGRRFDGWRLPRPILWRLPLPAAAAPGDTLPLRVAVRDAAFVPQSDATVDLRVTSPDGRHRNSPGASQPRAADSDVRTWRNRVRPCWCVSHRRRGQARSGNGRVRHQRPCWLAAPIRR